MNGGARPGAGRKKGVPNKSTAEIRDLARNYAPEAVAELARLSKEAQSEQARVAAIGMLLDRGYGKSVQPIDGDGEGGPIRQLVEVRFFKPNSSGKGEPSMV